MELLEMVLAAVAAVELVELVRLQLAQQLEAQAELGCLTALPVHQLLMHLEEEDQQLTIRQ
jgi:hypothetical protein